MMASIYHRLYILDPTPRRKRVARGGRLRRLPVLTGALLLALLPLLAGCDAVQVAEGSSTHVSIRYDGVMNGLDKAKQLAQNFCGQYGRTAKLRNTYWEGLGVGERFAFFNCI
jgi:hypothetical protein